MIGMRSEIAFWGIGLNRQLVTKYEVLGTSTAKLDLCVCHQSISRTGIQLPAMIARITVS